MDKSERVEISVRFKEFRDSTGKTQKEISNLAGISQATISRTEAGEIFPPWELISFLHKSFNLDINWLITGEGEMYVSGESIDKDKAMNILLEGRPINEHVKLIMDSIGDPILQNEMVNSIVLAMEEPLFQKHFLKRKTEKEGKVMVGR